jgi:predicted CopG family antitoxin
MTAEYTTLKVSKKLTEKLKELGGKRESYEDIIWRLIENKNENVDIEAVQQLRRQIEALAARLRDLASQGVDKNSKK